MQILDDDHFIQTYMGIDGRINSYRLKKISDDELSYLNNRFKDSFSLKETLQRIFYKVYEHPKCPTCGKYLPFYGKPKSKIGMFLSHCNVSCANSDPNVYNKQNNTKLQKYGSKNNYQKIQSTVFKKYNVINIFNLQEVRNNNIKIITSKESIDKRKNTCLLKYNVDSYTKTKEFWNKYDKVKAKEKEIKTKKKNGTLNTSKPEKESFKLLKEKYPDVQYQYKSKEYPFVCDFYIPKLNLYIECNYHWTHGGHPYDSNNINDYNTLKLWESKNSKFYRNAIITWTCRDVNKRNVAIQNNLNYIEFWNINELKDWLHKNIL